MEEEQQNGELTFKMIWQKIKISGVRILVYAMIGIIITAGIMGICSLIVTNSQYETKITYYYSGVEKGDDPWGGQMNLVDDIRSSSNVRNALVKCGYDEATIDVLVDIVIENLSVVPVSINEIKDGDRVVSNDYNYRIILAQNPALDRKIGSRNEYSTIVDSITTTYIETFKSKYNMTTKLAAIDGVSGESVNTVLNFSSLRQNLNTFAQELKGWAQKAPEFISSSQGVSYSTLASQVASLSIELDRYRTHILTNAIDGNGEKAYIELKLNEYNAETSAYAKQVSDLKEALASIQTIITTPGSSQNIGVVIQESQKLQDALLVATDKHAAAMQNQEIWTSYLNDYNANADNFAGKTDEEKKALYDKALLMANGIINDYNALLNSYNEMLKDYNSGYSINSLVRVTSGARQTTFSPITKMMFFIIIAVVIILAVIIAMVVTSKKGAMKIAALTGKKKTEEEDQIESAVEEEIAQIQDEEDKENLL